MIYEEPEDDTMPVPACLQWLEGNDPVFQRNGVRSKEDQESPVTVSFPSKIESKTSYDDTGNWRLTRFLSWISVALYEELKQGF